MGCKKADLLDKLIPVLDTARLMTHELRLKFEKEREPGRHVSPHPWSLKFDGTLESTGVFFAGEEAGTNLDNLVREFWVCEEDLHKSISMGEMRDQVVILIRGALLADTRPGVDTIKDLFL